MKDNNRSFSRKHRGQSASKQKRKRLSTILYHCLWTSNGSENDVSHEEKIDKEMKQYEEYILLDVDLDPLTWWKDEQNSFLF